MVPGAQGQGSTLACEGALAIGAELTPERLCHFYAVSVYRFAMMLCHEDLEASDLAQDTLERAIRRLPTYDPRRGTVDSWLWSIAVSAAADARRLAGRRRRLLWRLSYLREARTAHDKDFADSLADDDLLAAVRRLPDRDRAIVALRFGAGLSFAQIGSALGMSPASAGVACRRALARLRKDLTSLAWRRL